MIANIERKKVFAGFFGENLAKIGEFGIKNQIFSTIDAAFGIKGLNEVIGSTYHLAEWKMVVFERTLASGNIEKEFAVNLVIGSPEKELEFRYFPEIVVNKKELNPKQFARLHLNYREGKDSRFEKYFLIIKDCKVINGSVIFGIKHSQREKDKRKNSRQNPTSINLSLRTGTCEVKFN